MALKLGIKVTIILPPRGEPDLSVTSLEELRANLTAIEIENAKASYEEDEIKVKHEIQTTSSYEEVNAAVKRAMEEWCLRVVHNYLVAPEGSSQLSRTGTSMGTVGSNVSLESQNEAIEGLELKDTDIELVEDVGAV